MTPDEIRCEAHRVISGHADFPAIGFPHDPWAMDAVMTWTRMFLERASDHSTLQLALFIRKLAIHIVRTGKAHYHASNYAFGATYFARKPATLETKLTFGGAMQREFNSTCARFRRIDGPERDTARADLKARLLDKPLLLVSGGYTLHQLVHAQHVLEAGMLAGNCLVHEVKGTTLPNPAYWLPIKRGDRLLFALSHQDRLCCLISIVSAIVTEMEFLDSPPGLPAVLPFVVQALQQDIGTLWPANPNMRWPFPPVPPLPMPPDPHQLSFRFWRDAR